MKTVDLQYYQLKVFPISKIPNNTEQLQLAHNSLVEIPKEIIELQDLKFLDVKFNQLKSIHSNISKLLSLERVMIQGNNLTEVPLGLFLLFNLKILYLSENKLISVPSEIGNLVSLTNLSFKNNKIEELPETIGDLINLTTLNLDNNPIKRLPKSFLKLKNLRNLSLNGTKLPLPIPYRPNEVQKTLNYIFANQEKEEKAKKPTIELGVKKAYIFKNLSLPFLKDKFQKNLDDFTNENGVEFIEINDLESVNKEINILINIVGDDVHENEDLIFNILDKCINNDIPYKVLYPSTILEGNKSSINLIKGSEIYELQERLNKQYKSELNSFSSYDEFKGLLTRSLQQHTPKVLLQSLELINIGHFKNEKIDFDKHLTCLIGENGQGKSSVLGALGLAIMGLEQSKIPDGYLQRILRIESVNENGNVTYVESGEIILEYKIDNESYKNSIYLSVKDEGRIIEYKKSGDFEINLGTYNLKALILGFPQLRGKTNNHALKNNSYSLPHIDDLKPLVFDQEDNRLDSFTGWIASLYIKATNSKNEKEATKEYEIINHVFKIISTITGKSIKFITLKGGDPPVVIVTAPDTKSEIPLYLISQGFKVIISWVGYFIKRKIEAFPLSTPAVSSKEKSILIIDEIDSSIHPIWQARLLSILKEQFPKTQIIATTHSPLLINGLKKKQLYVVENDLNGRKIIRHPDEDAIGLGVEGILIDMFGLETTFDKVTIKKNEEYKKLLIKKTNGTITNNELSNLKKLGEFLSKYRLDPALEIVKPSPIIQIVEDELEKRKIKYTDINREALSNEISNILDDLLK